MQCPRYAIAVGPKLILRCALAGGQRSGSWGAGLRCSSCSGSSSSSLDDDGGLDHHEGAGAAVSGTTFACHVSPPAPGEDAVGPLSVGPLTDHLANDANHVAVHVAELVSVVSDQEQILQAQQKVQMCAATVLRTYCQRRDLSTRGRKEILALRLATYCRARGALVEPLCHPGSLPLVVCG